jgi:hypothetical protein
MTNIIALKQAGQSVTIGVTASGPSQVGNYPELEITGLDGEQEVTVRMPRQSADRQLNRLGVTDAQLVGKIVTISRDPNKMDASKPYWGLTIAGEFTPPKSNGHAPVQQAPAETPSAPDKLKDVMRLQELAFTHALRLAAVAEKAGIAPTFEGVSALTAQVLIEASRRGVA